MDTVVAILVGVFIGSVITDILFYVRFLAEGTLRIDTSDPEKDTFRIEFDDLDILSKKKRVVLKVDTHADLSQK